MGIPDSTFSENALKAVFGVLFEPAPAPRKFPMRSSQIQGECRADLAAPMDVLRNCRNAPEKR
jgi:hypothetical protein